MQHIEDAPPKLKNRWADRLLVFHFSLDCDDAELLPTCAQRLVPRRQVPAAQRGRAAKAEEASGLLCCKTRLASEAGFAAQSFRLPTAT